MTVHYRYSGTANFGDCENDVIAQLQSTLVLLTVISSENWTAGYPVKLTVTVIALVPSSARDGSRVNYDVAASKLYPLKGHVVIGTPVSLSLKEN